MTTEQLNAGMVNHEFGFVRRIASIGKDTINSMRLFFCMGWGAAKSRGFSQMYPKRLYKIAKRFEKVMLAHDGPWNNVLRVWFWSVS
jgi:hypothetical protein